MNTRKVLCTFFAFAAAVISSPPANAQLARAYLSSSGRDGAPCTLNRPCRMLPAALDAIVDGGEIWMLDPADYNTASVTITKSASIQAVPGAVASLASSAGGPAIRIGASGLTIALRNLQIVSSPGSGGTHGIAMIAASTLTIENSLIANQPMDGIYVFGASKLKVTNTIIRNNGFNGLELSSGVSAEISGTQMLNNAGAGVLPRGGSVAVSISDSIISGSFDGVFAFGGAADAVRVAVTRCTIEGITNVALNSEAFGSGGSIVIAVSGSTIVNNNFAWRQVGTGSVIRSLGNNHITDNLSAPIGVLTPTALQ